MLSQLRTKKISLTVTCQMDFSLFPMDKQKCPIYIESYSYTVQEVYYGWYKTNGELAKTRGVEWIATEGPIFHLMNVVTQEKDVSNNSKGAFSRLTAVFHLQRRYGYYIWNIYLPGGFLVVMTWVNFWIPSSAYPARVTVSITSFLSTVLIISGAGRSVSRLSYLKAIDWFLIGNASFIFMTLVEYVLVLHCNGRQRRDIELTVHSKKRRKDVQTEKRQEFEFSYGKENHAFTITDNGHSNGFLNSSVKLADGVQPRSPLHAGSKQRSRWALTRLLQVLKTPGEKTGTEPINKFKGHPIDRLSRIVFPLGYVLFTVAYLVYYLNRFE